MRIKLLWQIVTVLVLLNAALVANGLFVADRVPPLSETALIGATSKLDGQVQMALAAAIAALFWPRKGLALRPALANAIGGGLLAAFGVAWILSNLPLEYHAALVAGRGGTENLVDPALIEEAARIFGAVNVVVIAVPLICLSLAAFTRFARRDAHG
ncbi:hypothetical protein [Pontivivens ytuae]|uniref:Uncharacterized protein n=1 Tax=Pontivivens ytuae TaxID=2789856 RepID=A0A7S9LQW9_9RHOB|nr:hypothetical protein [Pontivivens ytuae]QPH53577.1 hypothetical protein I0K15_17620 [Pontivivens ytuae]